MTAARWYRWSPLKFPLNLQLKPCEIWLRRKKKFDAGVVTRRAANSSPERASSIPPGTARSHGAIPWPPGAGGYWASKLKTVAGINRNVRIGKGMLSQGRSQFGGGDRLTHVTLRMFRDVGQQTDDRGGEALAAHRPRVGQSRRIRCPDDRFGVAEGVVQGGQKLVAGQLARRRFRRHGCQLRRQEFPALEVGHEAVRATRNMQNVERHRCQAVRGGPQARRWQARGVLSQVLTRHLHLREHGQ